MEELEVAPVNITVTRGPEHIIEFENPAVLRSFGLKPGDRIGRKMADCHAPESAARFLPFRDQVYRTGKVCRVRDFGEGVEGTL